MIDLNKYLKPKPIRFAIDLSKYGIKKKEVAPEAKKTPPATEGEVPDFGRPDLGTSQSTLITKKASGPKTPTDAMRFPITKKGKEVVGKQIEYQKADVLRAHTEQARKIGLATNALMGVGLATGLAEAPLATAKAVAIFEGVHRSISAALKLSQGKNPIKGDTVTVADAVNVTDPRNKAIADLGQMVGEGFLAGGLSGLGKRVFGGKAKTAIEPVESRNLEAGAISPESTVPPTTPGTVAKTQNTVRKSTPKKSVPLSDLRKTNPEYLSSISNQDGTVTVYRNVGVGGRENIVPFDYVSTKREYAEGYIAGGKIVEQKIPIEDLSIGTGMDAATKGEMYYTPRTVAGEKFTPKVTESVNQKAIEQGITKGFEDLPFNERVTFADQARRVAELIEKDPVKAERILTGEEALPGELRASALIAGIEQKIKLTGNAELAYKLANSPLTFETSIHAQELSLLRMREPDSITASLADIKRAREANVTKTTGETTAVAKQKVVTEIKAEVNKHLPKAKDWNAFIESIKCK